MDCPNCHQEAIIDSFLQPGEEKYSVRWVCYKCNWKSGPDRQDELMKELLERALAHGAVLTGKPDGTEPITVVFTCEGWRSFSRTLIPPPPVVPIPRPEPITVGEDWTEVPFLNATILLLIIAVLVVGIIEVLP